MIDVACFVGAYPFRELPHPDPDVLVSVLAREKLEGAWVGYLPAPWQRDPAEGNARLFALLEDHETLHAAPVVRPDWPRWQQTLSDCIANGAKAIRAYPMHWGMSYNSSVLTSLALACGDVNVPLLLTVRFEDLRQRSALDVAGDLTAAHVRQLVRNAASATIVVTGAGRDLIEETHWSLTPEEQARCYWDFAWVWGPPENHFAHLIETIGSKRFVFGTHWPLRLVQNSRANLDLISRDSNVIKITNASELSREK